MARRALPQLLVTVMLVALGSGCRPAPPLVVLISIDTLRADHLGCYGYAAPTSPRLDELCREAFVFDTAIAAAPSTLPSHASLFTSLPPQRHGASIAARRPVSPTAPTLAEVFRTAGWHTAAFHDGGQIAPVWGLGRGFERYETGGDDDFAPIVERGLAWLDQTTAASPDRPRFLFLHTYQVHLPYTPAAADLERFSPTPYGGFLGPTVGHQEMRAVNHQQRPLDEADRRHVVAAYDAEIFAMDRSLGRLLDGLRARGLSDSTTVVLTSDHGEEFGEHGQWAWHGHTLHDELLRVPLVIRRAGPRPVPGRSGVMVRGIDVAPTLLALAGLPAPASFEGRDLTSLMTGRALPAALALAALDGGADGIAGYALRSERWKWIGGRLFDLLADPGETRDVAAQETTVERGFAAALAADLQRRGRATGAPLDLDAETQRRLRALGYL